MEGDILTFVSKKEQAPFPQNGLGKPTSRSLDRVAPSVFLELCLYRCKDLDARGRDEVGQMDQHICHLGFDLGTASAENFLPLLSGDPRTSSCSSLASMATAAAPQEAG